MREVDSMHQRQYTTQRHRTFVFLARKNHAQMMHSTYQYTIICSSSSERHPMTCKKKQAPTRHYRSQTCSKYHTCSAIKTASSLPITLPFIGHIINHYKTTYKLTYIASSQLTHEPHRASQWQHVSHSIKRDIHLFNIHRHDM